MLLFNAWTEPPEPGALCAPGLPAGAQVSNMDGGHQPLLFMLKDVLGEMKAAMALSPAAEGFALLRDRLRDANSANPTFDSQYGRLMEVLQTTLLRLNKGFGDQIERVLAVGDWAREGIDLRNPPYDDIVLDIVLRSAERPFTLYMQLAEEVFNDLHDEAILVQFRLTTLPEWQRALSLAQAEGREEALGITLLGRA